MPPVADNTRGVKDLSHGSSMFSLPDTLFIGSLFCVLVLSVTGGDGLAVGGGMGVKDPNVEESTFVTTLPKAAYRNIQPCAVFCVGRGSREKFTMDWL